MHKPVLVALGDSVMWGQGLLSSQKFVNKVADIIGNQINQPLPVKMYAHSGAKIDVPDSNSASNASSIHGEIPRTHPTINEQLESVQLGSDEFAHIVLLNGGANDLGFKTYINPNQSVTTLESDLRKKLFPRLRDLLLRTRQRFPNALVIVPGYYPIFSRGSRRELIKEFFFHEKDVGSFEQWVNETFADDPFIKEPLERASGSELVITDFLVNRTIKHITRAHLRGLHWMRRTVSLANMHQRGGGFLFAHPAFKNEHSIFGNDPHVFGSYRLDNLADPMQDERASHCPSHTDTSEELSNCLRASLFHPNTDGAQRYTDAIVSAYRASQETHLNAVVDSLEPERTPIRFKGNTRRVFQQYNLYDSQNYSLSVRVHSQHLRIDVFQVVLTFDESTLRYPEPPDARVSLGGQSYSLLRFHFPPYTRKPNGWTEMYYAVDTHGNLRLSDIDQFQLVLDEEFTALSVKEVELWLNGIQVYSSATTWLQQDDRTVEMVPDYPG
jgi:lysophospholipase L1-like esterase